MNLTLELVFNLDYEILKYTNLTNCVRTSSGRNSSEEIVGISISNQDRWNVKNRNVNIVERKDKNITMCIELRKFKEENITQLIKWIHSKEELMLWAGPAYNFPFTKEQMLIELNKAEKECNKLIYSVSEKKGKLIIGHCQILLDKKNNSARFGKILIGNTKFRGKGFGQQIIKELLKIGFVDLKLHRIDLGVFDFNTTAIKSYEKSGFKKEGLLRDYRKVGDKYWSLINMSILENEYYELEETTIY